jgi:hypothetical protein
MPLRREDLPADPDQLAALTLELAEENERLRAAPHSINTLHFSVSSERLVTRVEGQMATANLLFEQHGADRVERRLQRVEHFDTWVWAKRHLDPQPQALRAMDQVRRLTIGTVSNDNASVQRWIVGRYLKSTVCISIDMGTGQA